MGLDSRILVLVVVPDAAPEEATLLQGFPPSLCENPWLRASVLLFPSSTFDLTPQGQEILLSRRLRSKSRQLVRSNVACTKGPTRAGGSSLCRGDVAGGTGCQ